MSYGIVRVQKFSAGSVKGIEIHDRRDKEFSHTNKDIDFSKSEENYDLHKNNAWEVYDSEVEKLATQKYRWSDEQGVSPDSVVPLEELERLKDKIKPHEQKSFYKASKERIDSLNLPKAVRKDAVVMAQVLVTSDKAFFDGLSEGETKQFFRDSYEFLCNRYGKENAISATVHMDERTPHMHFNFVPVTADGRLSAKDVLTRKSLTEQQTAFYEQVGKAYGLQRGEPKESGKRRTHLKTDEYKAAMKETQTVVAHAKEIKKQAENARTTLEKVTDKVKHLEGKKEGLEREIDTLEAKLLTSKEVEALDEKANKTLTGGLKGVSYKDYQALKATAEQVDGWQVTANEAVNQLDRLTAEVQRLQGLYGKTMKFLEKHFPETFRHVKNQLYPPQSPQSLSLDQFSQEAKKIRATQQRPEQPMVSPKFDKDER